MESRLGAPNGVASLGADGLVPAAELPPSAGGGGTATAIDVLYSGGAYPTQPASPPAGILVRHFYGPTQYSGPTWAGVLDTYTYAALT
jgi:hypothetical protein